MARLEGPGDGVIGWEYTEDELVTGKLEDVEIACYDSDEQLVWEILLEKGPAGVRAVAQYYLDARRSLLREHLVFLVGQEEAEPGSVSPPLEPWKVDLAKKWRVGEDDVFLARRYFREVMDARSERFGWGPGNIEIDRRPDRGEDDDG